jgi:hypothetical protein
MNPRPRSAGTAGIAAGVALIIIFLLFMTSGITPETFMDPAKALPYVQEGGARLRTIALIGVATTALATVFLAGLAAKLQAKTPTRAAATLYFGILGNVGHGIGSVAYWLGVPMFAMMSARDQVAASHAWGAFTAITNGYDGFGNASIGLSLLAAGSAAVAEGALPAGLAWVGIVGGLATLALVLWPAMSAAFPVSLILTAVFLAWAGNELRKGK